jgi:hypothetical protein
MQLFLLTPRPVPPIKGHQQGARQMLKKFIALRMYRYYQRKAQKEPTIANYAEMAKWNNRWYRLEYPNAIQRAW